MPLINTSVPNLIQGVSQQPDATRFAGQCDEQENALSSVAEGLKKRPNTRHIGRLLTTAIDENSFVHFINRDESEKYVIIHDGTALRAFDLEDGDECTINDLTTGITPSATNFSYINTTTPRDKLKALTVADSTFIVNTDVEVKEDTMTISPPVNKDAFIFIKQGDYSKRYSVHFSRTNNVELSFSDPGYSPYMTWRTVRAQIVNQGSGYLPNHVYYFDVANWNFTQYNHVDESGYSGDGRAYPDNGWEYTTQLIAGRTNSQGSFTELNSINLHNKPHSPNVFRQPSYYGFDETNSGGQNIWVGWYSAAQLESFSLPVMTEHPVIRFVDNTGANDVRYLPDNQIAIGPIIASGDAVDLPTVTYTTPKASFDGSSGIGGRSRYIAENIYTNTVAQTSITNIFNVEQRGNGVFYDLKSNATGATDFFIRTSDDLADKGMQALYKSVPSITDLPNNCVDNFKIKVNGDADINQDDYYVEFETSNGIDWGDGHWNETVGFEISTALDLSTMPLELVNTGDKEFTLRTASWAGRGAGDRLTNPPPSFINKKIKDMFVFKNRLGMMTDNSVVLSEAGNYFNFYRLTVSALLDSAPIDVEVANVGVTNLRAAKAFQGNLVLFGQKGQYVLKGGDILTPQTVSIAPITNFNFDTQFALSLGSYIYFPFNRGNHSGIREFAVNSTTDNYDSLEITEHVPAYIPKNIIDMAGSSSEDIVVLLSGDEKGSLYVYNYFWNNNQKILSSWSKFTFNGEIRGVEFISSSLYMVMTDDHSNTHLVELPLEAGLKDIDHTGASSEFLTLLDRRVRAKVASGSRQIQFEKADGTYALTQDAIPYSYYNGGVAGYILPEVLVDSTAKTHELTFANIQGNGGAPVLSVAATSDLYGYVGLPYTMKYKFSTQVFKAAAGKSSSPTNASAMQVRNGTMFFDDTHTFDVKVTPENRTTATSTFLADDMPEAEQLGAVKFAEGNFRFPIYSKAKHANVLIENSSPFDSKFSSAEFESFVHPRSGRYG